MDQRPAARLGIESRRAAFQEALLGDDELGVVIRAHIYVEHELIAFIRATMSPPEALDAIKLDYEGRVKLAMALGLPAHFKPALSFLGTLRNSFAHRLDATLTKQEANGFAAAMGPNKAVAGNAYRATQTKFTSGDMAVPVSDRAPKDRVILYLITLWSGIAVAAVKVRGQAE